MQHDQGFTGSHWMPPLDKYSLRIAPAAARATINTMIIQKVPTLLAVSMIIAMRQYYTAQIARWRRFMAFIKATKHHHRTSTCSDIIMGNSGNVSQGLVVRVRHIGPWVAKSK
jgi:hypothetical protein